MLKNWRQQQGCSERVVTGGGTIEAHLMGKRWHGVWCPAIAGEDGDTESDAQVVAEMIAIAQARATLRELAPELLK